MSARAYSSCTSLLLTVASFGLGYYSVFIDRIAQFNRELSLVLNRFNRKTIVEFVLVGSLGPVLIEVSLTSLNIGATRSNQTFKIDGLKN